MYTDMVGYTALGQRNEALSLALVEEQRKLIRPVLNRHSGREVKTMGDAFLVEFSSALDAVRCAYDIQRAIRELDFSLPEDRRIHLRIGIHLGDVVESAGDISGDAVNVASRIQLLAEDGGVCLSRQVYDHIQNKFGLPLTSLGIRPLRNVSTPLEVYRMVMPWYEETALTQAHPEKRRIAVLPFANISPDPADEYFADGMTEELITTLSRLRGLTVISRTSVMKYKASPKGASEIGRELNSGSLIEGSVRKSGDRVRITVQLIDTSSEGQVWAQNYDKQLDDIFAIQSEIAEKVTKELKIQLLESERRGLETRPTEDAQAYTLYLRARFHWNSRSAEGLEKAIHYFDEAVGRDPEYNLALVGLADCYHISALFGYTSPRDVYPKARELADRALKAGDALAEVHATMGELLMHYSYDWAGAARELERALQINPNYAPAHLWRSTCHAVLGQFDNAVAEARRGEELDPFAVVAMNEVAKNYYYARRYDDAIKQFTHSLEIDPDSAYLHKGLAETYAQSLMRNEATREIERALAISGRAALYLDSAASVYALSGEDRKSREVLAEAEKLAEDRFVPSYGRAAAYGVFGNRAKAFQLLQTAHVEHSWLIWLGVDPIFDSLRKESAFNSLLQKMNLMPDSISSAH